MTYGDLFTGFGGATMGAMAAGLQPLWGIEYDARIAEVANRNLGGHVITSNILDVDPALLAKVDVLHASPPCPSFSVAKTDATETPLDISLARKVAQFVTVLQPRVFTLENVYGYRHSQSWAIIQEALHLAGYWVSVEHVNAADMGVAQTRKRMIVRAVRGGWVPYLPQPVAWVGWYEAIEDLLPGLPDSQFANWQLARLPAELRTYLVQVQGEAGDGLRYADEPMQTLSATHGPDKYRAFLVGKSADKFGDGLRHADEPAQTIGANEHGSKAWLKHGRVVSMTPRALARFQAIPDWYELPDSKTLAARGIGNAVPPLLMQRVYEGLRSA